MTLNDRQKLGIAILAVIVGALIIWYFFIREDPNPDNSVPDSITVVGYGGAVKAEFFENAEVTEILSDRYGITVEIEGTGTLALLCEVPLEGVDFLWAGDQSQIPIYEECRSRSDFYRNLVNTPLVIYSWTDTTDALIEAGVVELGEDGVHRIDMMRLVALIESDQSWSDLGFPDRPSNILVKSTDPNASTSGQLFSGLMANTMNCLDVVNNSTVAPILPGIHNYFGRLGFMPEASVELFRLYISQGEGAYPLVALLESQIIETTVENPQMVQQVQSEVRVLYPEPTVWLTHPMIALTEGGQRLTEAMLDPDIQRLGWPKQGFRPSVPGVEIDLSALPIRGVQEDITSVIDTPANPVMDQILEAVTIEYVPDPTAPPPPVCDTGDTSVPSTPGAAPASPVAARSDSP